VSRLPEHFDDPLTWPIGPSRPGRAWNLLLPAIAAAAEFGVFWWLIVEPSAPLQAGWLLSVTAAGSFALLLVLGAIFEGLWPGRRLALPLLSANLGNLAVQSSLLVVLWWLRDRYQLPDMVWSALFLLLAGLAATLLLLPMSWAIQVLRQGPTQVHKGYGTDIEVGRW
jgi:hypothetical protein